jgi:hypothetical protein
MSGFSGSTLTIVGAFGAMLGFLQTAIATHVPGTEQIPPLLVLGLGVLGAGVTFYLGKTNPGTDVQKPPTK